MQPKLLVKPQLTALSIPFPYMLDRSQRTVSAMAIIPHLLLICSLLAVSLSCIAGAAPPPVYDTDGHPLSSDASYYVLPAVRGHGGGLTLAPLSSRCPLYVAQEADELRRGLPVRFTPLQQGGAAPDAVPVHVSFDVRVHFDAYTTCVQSTEWHVAGKGRVVTGPVRPVRPTTGRENVFRVERHGRVGYKIVSCSKDKCQDLGVLRDGRGVWLGATDRAEAAHEVVFKKAPRVFPLPPAPSQA